MATELSEVGPAALAALEHGHTLGRYELLAPIGRGGMAVVWAARLTGTRGFSKVVALKTMLQGLSADPRFERMFLKEADIARSIDHPNVCQVLDLGEQRGVLYLVMEWIDGDSLATLRDALEERNERVPVAIAARIAEQAARGLAAAHSLRDDAGEHAGVVHRDVSPQNILLRADGLVKIVDFGVAKALERTDHTTQSGFIKGKVAYLAPEQAQGLDVDPRADVFSLGVVVYELLTGVHPFRAASDVATLLRVSSDEPARPVRALRADVPDRLARTIERALAKTPSERHPSMLDLARELAAAAAEIEAGEEPSLAAFVRDALGDRRAERARLLREAAAIADERAARAQSEPATRPDPARPAPRSRLALSIGITVAVGALGVAIGAGVRPEGRAPASAARPDLSTPPSPSPAASVSGSPIVAASQSAGVPPPATSTLSFPAVAPSAGATTSSGVAWRAPRPPSSPAASTRPAADAPSTSPPPATTPSTSAGEARFRDPGF
ncbi:MAG: protein kinase [Deltaproteobacteria bacterium]|nr:protein kinase [Deltaproteobacteria bacterium]